MHLNDDVATEILLRLPVQSLLRFRTVCKSWCNVIDSSTFRTSQLHNQSENDDGETLFLHITMYSPFKVSIINADTGKWLKSFPAHLKFDYNYFGSGDLSYSSPVNGLICVYSKTPSGIFERPIGIYNPCLDKIKILPLSPMCSSMAECKRIACSREIGFGFDNATKNYKVVQLISFCDGHTCVELYLGTTETWRKLVTDFNFGDYYLCKYNFEGIKSRSGSCAYWQTQRRFSIEYVILSFNMQNEVFKTIPYPDFGREVIDLGHSQVFAKGDGSFALFISTCHHCRLEVWLLEDNERCWTHVRDVNIEEQHWSFSRALWKRDAVVMLEYCYDKPDSLIFCNYSTGEVIKRCEMPKSHPEEIFEYKASLILP